jgi:hypothetical protein
MVSFANAKTRLEGMENLLGNIAEAQGQSRRKKKRAVKKSATLFFSFYFFLRIGFFFGAFA